MSGIDKSHSDDEPHDLAAEYVLGTLTVEQRQQFEEQLQTQVGLRKEVADWQARLYTLHDGIAPIKPPKRVWKNIQTRLFRQETRTRLLHRLGIWQTFSAISSVALVVLLVQYINLQQLLQIEKLPTPLPESIALLSNKQSEAGWLVERLDIQGQMAIKAFQVTDPGLDKSYELWMLPTNGQPPKSLGLLITSGEHNIKLNLAQLEILNQSNALAVSLEPAGGSPTGLPTGPVLYQGKLLSL